MIIAVVSDKDIRIKRIINRDGITLDEANLRISKQHNDIFYTKNADYVIVNNEKLDEVNTQVKNIYTSLFRKASK